jgi:hypothetical protein
MSLGTYEPWTGAMITMLRVLIDDNAYQGSYVYTDPRLRELLAVAAMYVVQDITFSTTYAIDVVGCTISPDPYTAGDVVFQNMVVMKAACLIDHGTFRQKAFTSGLEAKCGPATMKTLNQLAGFKDLLTIGPCGIYEKLKEEQLFSGESLSNLVHFVLSPFTHDDFDPVTTFQNYSDTDRFIR